MIPKSLRIEPEPEGNRDMQVFTDDWSSHPKTEHDFLESSLVQGIATKRIFAVALLLGPAPMVSSPKKKKTQREFGKSGCALYAQPSSWPELQCCWKSGHYLKTKIYIVFPPDTRLQTCACAHHSCLHIQSGWCRCRRLRRLEDQQTSQDRGNNRDRIRSAEQMPNPKTNCTLKPKTTSSIHPSVPFNCCVRKHWCPHCLHLMKLM